MICKCSNCSKKFDSHDEGYEIQKPFTRENTQYCEDCFTEEFQCEDCGGFKNKFAMAVYDGEYCDC